MPTASSRRARVLASCCAFAVTTQLASPVMAFDKDHVRYATASIVDKNGASGEKWSAPALRLPTNDGEIFCGFQFVAPTAIDNATVTVTDISQGGVTFAAAAGKDDRPAQAQVTVRARFLETTDFLTDGDWRSTCSADGFILSFSPTGRTFGTFVLEPAKATFSGCRKPVHYTSGQPDGMCP